MIYEFKVIGEWRHPVNFELVKVGTIVEFELRMSSYDDFVAQNPALERYIGTAPAVTFEGRIYGGGTGLEARQPDTFKEVLAKIGEAHPISPLADRYRKNKTVKEIKTREARERHRKKDIERGKMIRKKVRNKIHE